LKQRTIYRESGTLTVVYTWSKTDIYKGGHMAAALTSIQLDKRLANEAVRALGVKSRTEAVQSALREIVRLREFKKLMKDYGGKGNFAGLGE
jgi:hypothetical protein